MGAISGLTADTSQMDPVAEQGGMFGERDICYLHIRSKPHLGGRGKKAFLSEHIFYVFPVLHTSPFPELHSRNSQ